MEVKNITLFIILMIIMYKYNQSVTKFNKKVLLAGIIGMSIPIIVSGFNLKLIIFSCILLCASYIDLKDRVVPDYLHIMIAILAIDDHLYTRLACLVIATLPMFIVALVAGNIGGADLKICMACNYFIGNVVIGISATVFACLLAIVINLIKKNKDKGFAMVPYIAAGYMIAISIDIIQVNMLQ